MNLKLSKDGLLKISGGKVVADYHFARLRVEKEENGVKLSFVGRYDEVVEVVEMESGEVDRLVVGVHMLGGYKEEEEPDINKM